jgi:hypothetical protein
MLFAENGFHSREKYHIRKIFCYIRKNFFIFRKKCDICGKVFLVCPENFFEMNSPPPPWPTFPGKKILDALFYWKNAPQSLPPPTFRSFLRP